jgi:hypothetical protein
MKFNKLPKDDCQQEIGKIIKEHPTMLDYFEEIATVIGCSVSELTWLDTRKELGDCKGWDIQDFFEGGIYDDFGFVELYEDYQAADFSVGLVCIITQHNEVFHRRTKRLTMGCLR